MSENYKTYGWNLTQEVRRYISEQDEKQTFTAQSISEILRKRHRSACSIYKGKTLTDQIANVLFKLTPDDIKLLKKVDGINRKNRANLYIRCHSEPLKTSTRAARKTLDLHNIRAMKAKGFSMVEIAKRLGISYSCLVSRREVDEDLLAILPIKRRTS